MAQKANKTKKKSKKELAEEKMTEVIEKITKNFGNDYAVKIKILELYENTKASEKYARVEFRYDNEVWRGSVPYQYPRGGVIPKNEKEVASRLEMTYDCQHPEKKEEWEKNERKMWKNKKDKTWKIFRALMDSEWHCSGHGLGSNRSNVRSRIKAIKNKGYTFGTDLNKFCDKCGTKTSWSILLRTPRGGVIKDETISAKLRERIIKVLRNWDVYEDRSADGFMLPEHKFPEVRWDTQTSKKNLDSMTDDEIRNKFQLMDNRRNQQKREACRNCLQTGIRGTIYGLKYYYKHGETWPKGIPKRGKKAEEGCVGCGWYDTAKWREEHNKKCK